MVLCSRYSGTCQHHYHRVVGHLIRWVGSRKRPASPPQLPNSPSCQRCPPALFNTSPTTGRRQVGDWVILAAQQDHPDASTGILIPRPKRPHGLPSPSEDRGPDRQDMQGWHWQGWQSLQGVRATWDESRQLSHIEPLNINSSRDRSQHEHEIIRNWQKGQRIVHDGTFDMHRGESMSASRLVQILVPSFSLPPSISFLHYDFTVRAPKQPAKPGLL